MQPINGVPGFRSAQMRPEGRLEGLDEYFERLADSVPGFAGLYYDAYGDAVINVTDDDPAKRSLLATTLKAFLTTGANGRPGSRPAVRFSTVHHDYAELMKWRRWSRKELMSIPGATQEYIDDPRNILVVGAVNATAQRAIVDRIAREEGAPILVESRDYVSMTADSLTSARAQAVGGMQISTDGVTGRNNGRIFRCTMGFNAQRSKTGQGVWDGTRFGITAGHCTPVFSQWDGGTLWNPWGNVTNRRRVGVEYRESEYFPRWTLATCPYYQICYPECPTPAVCSLADAAMADVG